ncbi:unnamed protein product [Urochloa humidicola]
MAAADRELRRLRVASGCKDLRRSIAGVEGGCSCSVGGSGEASNGSGSGGDSSRDPFRPEPSMRVHEVSGCVERAEAVRCGGHEQSTGSRASPTIRLLRLEYIMLTEVLDIIGRKNWCREVVDNLREVAQLYEKDYMLKGLSAPINGCGFFLVASSLPHTGPPEPRIISSSNLFKALFQLDKPLRCNW